MCGIAGRLNYLSGAPVDRRTLTDMVRLLAHRGPDGEGVSVDGRVGFAHRRLAIIDLSDAARQPMATDDGQVWITFNGEIYNFQEIRHELEGRGARFRTRSDTEVVLAAYREWGVACLDRLRGMFAFGIWDAPHDTLILARDRLGKKPLCFRTDDDGMAFASEPKAFLAEPGFRPDVDFEAISHYLTYQYVPAPMSAFRGVRKLPPAHYLLVRAGQLSIHRYWRLRYGAKRRITEAAAAEEVLARLREAVRLRLMSDVPLGGFLSGGIDSSAVVALMAQEGSGPVKTFSIGFDETDYDELPYARMVAKRYATNHHEFIVRPDAVGILPKLVWHYNEPFADSSAIPTFYLAELTRQHATVALSGDGGDENFAGYGRYLANITAGRYENVPRFIRAPLNALIGRLPAARPLSTIGRITRFVEAMPEPRERRYARWLMHFHPELKAELCTSDFLRQSGGDAMQMILDEYAASDARNFVDATLDVDVNRYLPDDLLVKVDVATMAHGLEARSPFLDHPFMEFAASLPSELKLHGRIKKHILKQAMRGLLPDQVITRPKMGFGVPIDHWFRGELKEFAFDLLLSRTSMARGTFTRRPSGVCWTSTWRASAHGTTSCGTSSCSSSGTARSSTSVPQYLHQRRSNTRFMPAGDDSGGSRQWIERQRRSDFDQTWIVMFRIRFPTLLLFVAGAWLTHPRAHIVPAQRIDTLAAARQPRPADAQAVAGEAAARVQCATCHKLPPPDVLPRSSWRDEIARMFLIRSNQPEPIGPPGTSARMVSLPPDWQSIVRYFEANAPDHLAPPAAWPAPDQTVPFRRRVVSAASGASGPAVASIRLVDLEHDGRLEMVLSDMRNGVVYTAKPYEEQPSFVEIGRLPNPAHIEPVDLDADGILDFLAGDLGSFLPSDHHRGAVVWLRGRKDGTYVPVTLKGWPRVSDVEAADFDGDGRLDLAVAAFGWRHTGDFTILKNDTIDYANPSFVPHQIDTRTGSIHAVPVDLNGDKKTDVIALFAQEHETVVAFLNQGGLHFDPQVIYAGPHPNWGSSGIQVVDLDKDGDLDVLMTNGDTFDDKILKPYHGIQWLENTGGFPFTEHALASMPAAYRAQAADLDGDGDLDIVACALVSSEDAETRGLPAVVWLEQTRPGVFERHVLEAGRPTHATLDVGDFDNDGDMDVVVGNFTLDRPVQGLVEIFENLRVRK